MSLILLQTRSVRQKIHKVLMPSVIALVLSACTGSGIFQNRVTESLKDEAYAVSEFYINKAEQASQFEEQQSYRLLAIRKLLEENKLSEAQETMNALNVAKFNEVQRLEHSLLSAHFAVLQGNQAQAKTLLKQFNLAQLSAVQRARLAQIQVLLAEKGKDVIALVKARIALHVHLVDNHLRQENNDKIWLVLRNANRGLLENTTVSPGEASLAGWLSLIAAYNKNIANPNALPDALNTWKAQYPNHSAVYFMPTELKNVTSFQQTQLNTVALLVPLSGEAKSLGEIIRKGFEDAKGSSQVNVQIMDTDKAPIDVLLNQAVQGGVQTVVGPLLKPRVDELLSSSHINKLNVLALNATANIRTVANVCYYGLSPEAEAQSAAERFERDDIQHAVVFAPQGDFGQRASDAFAQRWRQLTNKNADIRFYHQPLDAVAALQNSGALAKSSAIYLLGTAEQVLDMKQGLDSAGVTGQVSLYTSSRSNSPNSGPDFRMSMEGVKFSEIPLLAEKDSDEYRKANQLASSDFSMMRLYAMGSDAWLIANKFNEFRQIPGYKISGLTGVLSSSANCNIRRDLSWLQYRNGEMISLN